MLMSYILLLSFQNNLRFTKNKTAAEMDKVERLWY